MAKEMKLLKNNSNQDIIEVPSVRELEQTYKLADTIFNNLDDFALHELMQGYGDDINNLMGMVIQETYNTIHAKKGPIQMGTFGYYEKLAKNVEETLRKENLNYFITSVLPEFEMNWHHIEWGNMYQLHKKINVIAARAHGKSYYFSLAVPVWRMYRYVKATIMNRTPTDYALSKAGMIITSEIGLAQHLVNIVKDTIENNDILKPILYPGSRDGWGGEEITCKNGAVLTAKSYGSKMRGYHPGYVVVDDFLTDQCLYSKAQRDKYTSIFHSVIMNMPPKNGSVAVVGTPFHTNDLYGDLKVKDGWICAEYPAIFPDGTILWPWLFDYKDIMEKQQTQGSIIFARENLCRAVSNESSLFPYEIINKAFEGMQHFTMGNNNYGYSQKFVRIVCGWDIARSANVGADYSVWTTIGVDERGHYWILNIRREKGKTFHEQIAIAKQLHANFNYDLMIIENNQMQQLFVDGAIEENIPAEGHTTGVAKYSLETGIPSLVVIFEQSRIHIPIGNKPSKEIADMLAQELNSMAWTDEGLQGVGNHDDMVMSLLMAIIAARKGDNFRWSFL